MKVLIVGSGGREHALTWKIAQSGQVDKIYCAPGNGGMARLAELVDIKAEDIEGLLNFAKEKKVGLTVVGPETPLVEGIVDRFQSEGLRVFGPKKELADLEGSKVFAKETMERLGVPTARFKVFYSPQGARDYIKKKGAPLVVKADGLAAGKGVFVCKTVADAIEAVKITMEDKKFGPAGDRVVIEDCLIGEEVSVIVLSDGENAVSLASSQDHKAIYDGDKGENTGGMGAYSPAPVLTGEMSERIDREIITPVIKGLAGEGKFYKGVLYAGIMITGDGPKVLEFNVRFGDPETQAVLPRLKDDLVELIQASIDGKLGSRKLNWDKRPCVSVVMASGGYPGKCEKGKVINGLEETDKMKDVVVFHAGTRLEERFVTTGGRVLNVTALGEDIKDAIGRAYEAVSRIDFDKAYYRRDIGHRALARIG